MKKIVNLIISFLIAIAITPLLLGAAAYFIIPIAFVLLNLLDVINAIIDLDIVAILTQLGILIIVVALSGAVLYLPFFLRAKMDAYLRANPKKQTTYTNFISSRRIKLITKITSYILLSSFAVIFLFPMFWMLASSTKPDSLTYQQMGSLASFFPSFNTGVSWFEGYKSVWVDFSIWKYGLNSLFYSGVIVTGNIFVNSMAGYALAKYNFPGKRLIFTVIIGLIIIPIETTIIPLYTIVHSLGLTGTVFAIMITPLVSVFNIFLFRQFFMGIPKEIEEAALLDGASKFRIYRSIILPLSKPILATVATFTFIGVWNDYVWPLMVLPPPTGNTWPLYPIQAALNTIQQHPTITTMEVMSSLTLTTIPLIIVYIAAQKYIVNGLGHTGMK